MNRPAANRPPNIVIRSFAFSVPERVLDNRELSQSVDTSDEWIVSHTGIQQRHIAADGQAASDLALSAARKLLQNSGVAAQEIDLIVLATSTPDHYGFPSTACILQDQLGCRNAAAFDISAACSGFIYALEVARAMLGTGQNYQKAIVVGAEVCSKIVNWQDRSTCVLFGDGAGAALLERSASSTSGAAILDAVLKSDGSGARKLWIPEGGSRTSEPDEHLWEHFGEQLEQNGQNDQKTASCAARRYIEMDGRAVYNFAVAANQQILNEMLERNHLKISDLRYIVPHQANLRIIQAVAKRERIPQDLLYINIQRYANTSAASIPIALAELSQSGELQTGDLVLCIGFGAGLTSGGVLLRWG